MDVRLTWTNYDEAGDYVVPNVFSPRDLDSRPDNMDKTVIHTAQDKFLSELSGLEKCKCLSNLICSFYFANAWMIYLFFTLMIVSFSAEA